MFNDWYPQNYYCYPPRDGFNPENMEISMLKGSAIMKNLKLKKSILDKFDLPIKISSSMLKYLVRGSFETVN